jgi:hypothetical protein
MSISNKRGKYPLMRNNFRFTIFYVKRNYYLLIFQRTEQSEPKTERTLHSY